MSRLKQLVEEHPFPLIFLCLSWSAIGGWLLYRFGAPSDDAVVLFLGIMASGFVGATSIWQEYQLAQRRRAAPNEPWRWRDDWSEGAVIHSHFRMMLTRWGALAVISVVGIGMAAFIEWMGRDRDYQFQFHWAHAALGALLLCLLAYAIIGTFHWLDQGRESRLELLTLPGRMGEKFRCVLDLAERPAAAHGFKADMKCVHIVGQGENAVAKMICAIQPIEPTPLLPQPKGRGRMEIPLSFKIPIPCQSAIPLAEFTALLDADEMKWIVTVEACAPGDRYHAAFEVPVFPPTNDGATVTLHRTPDTAKITKAEPPGSASF